MNKYRQARFNRKTKPRPKNTAARRLNAFINALFFCVWKYPSVNEDDVYMPSVQEPTVTSVTDKTSEPVNRENHGHIFFNKTNHEPRHSTNKDGGKAKKSFRWPWSKKKDEKKKIEIEVLTETLVHLDGFGGHGGPAVKDQDCVHLSQSGCAKLSVGSSSEASTSNMPLQQLSLESIKSQDELSAASIDSILSSLSSGCENRKNSLSTILKESVKSISRLASIASSLTSINAKKDQPKDKVEWGPLPISGSASSFDGKSTSVSEDNVSVEDRRESSANADKEDVVSRGFMYDVSIVMEEILNSVCLAIDDDEVFTEDKLQNTNKEDVVPGGSNPDAYALIKRTLNLVVPKPATLSSNGTELELSQELATSTDNDVTGTVPKHQNPSLHKMHTEWLPEDHENVEVQLGLKEKKSRDSIVDDENQSADKCDLPDASPVEDEEASGTAPEAEVQISAKMADTGAVDSGIACGNPSEMNQE